LSLTSHYTNESRLDDDGDGQACETFGYGAETPPDREPAGGGGTPQPQLRELPDTGGPQPLVVLPCVLALYLTGVAVLRRW
jgi:hypothetical protein